MYEGVLLTSVPPSEFGVAREALPGARVLAERLSPAVADRHPDVEVLSVMVHDRVDAEVLALFPRLRGVVTRSTGFDHLPIDWMRSRGLEACHLAGYATSSVAHLTLAFILGLLRRIPEAVAVTQGARRGGTDPPRWDRSRLQGRHLSDVTVGVLGTGRIGGEVVRLLSAMGANVTGHDTKPDPALVRVPRFRYVSPLSTFLAGCDVLTLHVPLTRETHLMIGTSALARLPPGALLVNTARGRVVDQLAVERALRAGRLGGYAADVLPGEPDPPTLSRFRDFTNVILTPHLGAYDAQAIRSRYEHTAQAAEAILRQEPDALSAFRVPAASAQDLAPPRRD